MTDHYWFAVLSVFSIVVFASSVRSLWQATRIRPENVHTRIRGWCESFNIGVAPLAEALRPNSFFGFDVTFWDRSSIWVLRTHARSKYLSFFIGVTPPLEQQTLYNSLNEVERTRLFQAARAEAAKAKAIIFQDSVNRIRVEKLLPITNQLSESRFIDTLIDINLSAAIVYNSLFSTLIGIAAGRARRNQSELSQPRPESGRSSGE